MPYVMIKDEDMKRINELKGIFEAQDVITRVLDHYLEEFTKPETEIQEGEQHKEFSFKEIPDLSFAKFVSGHFDNVAPDRTNWKYMMLLALETGYKRVGGFEKLQNVATVNLVSGEKSDEGYHFIEELGFSFQGVSAQYAAKCIGEIAEALDVPVEVSFRWRKKDNALHPGEAGKLVRHVYFS